MPSRTSKPVMNTPLAPVRDNATERAPDNAAATAAAVEMSGRIAPCRTARPTWERARVTRLAPSSTPDADKSSTAVSVKIAMSPRAPAAMRSSNTLVGASCVSTGGSPADRRGSKTSRTPDKASVDSRRIGTTDQPSPNTACKGSGSSVT